MNDVIAIIPARSGSKGVPDKNIKILNGYPLIVYSIAIAKMVGIKRVLISTDSEKYRQICEVYGAEVPFLRPKNISLDHSTDYEWAKHAMVWFKENESNLPEYWLHLRPTTPLRSPAIIKKAIQYLLKNKGATSLRSGHEAPESPFKWFLKDENGYFKGIREDLTPEKVNMPRQVFPKTYNPNGYIDIIRSSHVLSNSNMHGDKMLVFETPICHEIDSDSDFEYIEYEIDKKSSGILDWLKKYDKSKG